MSIKRLRFQHLALGLSMVLLFTAAGPLRVWWSHGDNLGTRGLQLSDNRQSASAEYTLSFAGQSAGTVGSVRAQFCANDPLVGTPCTAPSGFNINAASLSAQSGMGGFSIDATNTTANVLVLTRAPGPSVPGSSTYVLGSVVNPDTEGSYYVRIETFSSTDASGSNTDHGGLAFAIGNVLSINATVPPYLLFCVANTMPDYSCDTATGDFIDLGEFTSAKTSTAQTKMLVATNADFGYNIRVVGTTLTSGNNTIPPLLSSDYSRIGDSQFGLNLAVNSTPSEGVAPQGSGTGAVAANYNVPDQFRFNSGEVIAGSDNEDDYRRYTVSYVVNISKGQAPGVYVSTLTYVTLANF